MKALLRLTERASVLRVHVEAVGAAVDLRRPHLHELEQQRLDSGRIDGALQADHGPYAGWEDGHVVDPRRLSGHVRKPPGTVRAGATGRYTFQEACRRADSAGMGTTADCGAHPSPCHRATLGPRPAASGTPCASRQAGDGRETGARRSTRQWVARRQRGGAATAMLDRPSPATLRMCQTTVPTATGRRSSATRS